MCVGGRRIQPITIRNLQLSSSQEKSQPDVLTSLQSSTYNFPSLEGIYSSSINEFEKAAPKRRRKPQKPGKTAKNNDRHFVVHHYHDHSQDVESDDSGSDHVHADSSSEEENHHRRRGGVSVAFPVKLHEVLEQVEADGFAHIISWQIHGRAFMIHNAKEFVDYIMPRYFRQTKLTSFQRQLNLYGFNRITRGQDSGAYYSEYFLRWRVFLCKHMIRTKVKGTRFKAASNPENEPHFYSMPFVTPLAAVSVSSASSQLSMSPIPLIAQHSFDESLERVGDSVPNTQTISNSLSQFLAPYCKSEVFPKNATSAEVVSGGSLSNNDEDLDDLSLSSLEWDEGFDSAFEASLSSDMQLGYMLEKLLED